MYFSRRKLRSKKSAEFEDFGLADTDFPQNPAPVMEQRPKPSMRQANYVEDPFSNNFTPYQPQADIEYGMAAQPYYYPQQATQEQPYYDEAGYYYDGAQMAYPATPYRYPENTFGDQNYSADYYKPDQPDAKPHQNV
jgi:hypothetical protein